MARCGLEGGGLLKFSNIPLVILSAAHGPKLTASSDSPAAGHLYGGISGLSPQAVRHFMGTLEPHVRLPVRLICCGWACGEDRQAAFPSRMRESCLSAWRLQSLWLQVVLCLEGFWGRRRQ